jgi:hypothetical protein
MMVGRLMMLRDSGLVSSKADKVFITDPNTGTIVAVETNGGLAVNIQDQHTRMLDLPFINANPANFTTLTADASKGDFIVSVTQTTGMAIGSIIGLSNPIGNFYFGEITGIDSLDITLDTQLDSDFPSADSNVFPGTTNMNVEGTMANPIIFQVRGVGPGSGIEIDITRVMGSMTDGSAMTDELFGSLTALTNGIALRVINSTTQNIWNLKTNGAIALLCFDAQYPDKVPTGVYSFRFRNTFAGQAKHGVTIRLAPGDVLELLVQDDLTDLTDFHMMAQGHFVGN